MAAATVPVLEKDMEIPPKLIPLAWIKEDHATQIRGAVTSSRVRELEALLRETEQHLDPIDLFISPGMDPGPDCPFILADGFHRVAAYRGVGKTKIPCRFRFGDRSDAIEWGLNRNGRHGWPMTNKEKRAATEAAVLDPRIGEWPDARIARKIGVSPTLVNQIRRGIQPNKKRDPEETEIAEENARSRKSESPREAGKRETESLAPRAASVRQRQERSEADIRPTKAAMLRQIREWVDTDCIDDDDLLDILRSSTGQYVFVPKEGEAITLRVVGVSGRIQVCVPVTIKQVSYENIDLRYSAGKLREG